jgi:hypothetical protein
MTASIATLVLVWWDCQTATRQVQSFFQSVSATNSSRISYRL